MSPATPQQALAPAPKVASYWDSVPRPELQLAKDIPRLREEPLTNYYQAPASNPLDIEDVTTFVEGQEYLMPNNLPYKLGLLEQPVGYRSPDIRYITVEGEIVRDINGRPMKDLPILPFQISTKVEGWRMAAWMEYDLRVEYYDILARSKWGYNGEEENNPWGGERNALHALRRRVSRWRKSHGGLVHREILSLNQLAIIERTQRIGSIAHNTVWNVDLEAGLMQQPGNAFEATFHLPPAQAPSHRVAVLLMRLSQVKQRAQARGYDNWREYTSRDDEAQTLYLDSDNWERDRFSSDVFGTAPAPNEVPGVLTTHDPERPGPPGFRHFVTYNPLDEDHPFTFQPGDPEPSEDPSVAGEASETSQPTSAHGREDDESEEPPRRRLRTTEPGSSVHGTRRYVLTPPSMTGPPPYVAAIATSRNFSSQGGPSMAIPGAGHTSGDASDPATNVASTSIQPMSQDDFLTLQFGSRWDPSSYRESDNESDDELFYGS